jgi:hypothetical protein
MAGLDPAIHALLCGHKEGRGCPGPVSAKASPGTLVRLAGEALAKTASPGMTSVICE